ncbi:MAG: fibronectin type III domain-containing protein, partial [Gammaproteobacteria bacterium]|nr:fibronectin type III domain-containing protein [Gammaproteobacteria bacterium]
GVENPSRSVEIELKGITRAGQATEEANLALARGQLLRRRHTWRMAAEGQLRKRFDVLQLAAPRLTDAGRLAGRDATGLSITLPEQVDLGATATGNVWLYYPNGVAKHFACDCGLEGPVLYAAPIAAAATQPGSTAAYGRNRLRQIINHTDGIEVRIVNESGNLRYHQLSSSRGQSRAWLQLGSRLLNFHDASRTCRGNIQGIGPTASYRWRGVESGGWEAGQTARIGARYPIAYVLRLTLPALSATDGDTAAIGMEAAWKDEDIHYQFQQTADAELVAVTSLTPAEDGTVQVVAEDYLADYFRAKDNPAALESAVRKFAAPTVTLSDITQYWRYFNGVYERIIDVLLAVTGDYSGAVIEAGDPLEPVATLDRGIRARWRVASDVPHGNYQIRITPGSREFPLGTPATASVRLTDNDLRPDAPTQLSAHESLQRETVLQWTPPGDEDIAGYQVRLALGAASGAGWEAMVRAHTGLVAETFLRLDGIGPGAYTFAVKTINAAGNESDEAVFLYHTVAALPGEASLWYSDEALLAWPGTLNGFGSSRASLITKSSLTWDTLPLTWEAWTSWSQSPVATATYQREIDLGASRTFRIVSHADRTDGTGHAIEASWSADNATWSAFAAVSNAAVTARYVRVRLTAHTDGVTPACIKRFTILLTEAS